MKLTKLTEAKYSVKGQVFSKEYVLYEPHSQLFLDVPRAGLDFEFPDFGSRTNHPSMIYENEEDAKNALVRAKEQVDRFVERTQERVARENSTSAKKQLAAHRQMLKRLNNVVVCVRMMKAV